MVYLKNANEMCELAKAVSQDEKIKIAFTQLQTEIYNEASNGKFHLITRSLSTLNDKQLRIVSDKLKALGYGFQTLNDKANATFTSSESHKISWELKDDNKE